ncbi:hypothetical protein ACFYKT_19070 [Cytobacillus sp. FJAT-53684]|uniref:Uncharacterized protein n=1 Tax=Cytobacillus mangrovibacter TaxID=3299024 RepID=A0ABW6K2L3_9BACI
MADKTFGVKVNEDLYDKVKLMIDSSGISAKEWFEKAVSLTEMNAIKQGATDYSQDISELEVHTTRIYELVANMIQRSIYIKDHAVKEYADKLDQRESIIGEYQDKAKVALEEAKASMQMAEVLEKEKTDLSKQLEKERADLLKQLEEVRSVNLNNQLLIDEYKEKNDTLSGLVSKYQSFAEENEKLKDKHADEQERLHSQVVEISTQAHDQQDEIKDLNQQIEMMKNNHEIALERLTEKKEYEKDKALLECERNYQEKWLKANDEYNEKIKELYNEISVVRKEYEEKVKNLEIEVKNVKAERDQ